MNTPRLRLISHVLCPYVQRAVIVLTEKNVPFERIDVDLAAKPDWFLRISPLGKTPVLLVDDVPVFESAVICEYLDETLEPRLHPNDALERARHRAYVEFASASLSSIWQLYTAPNEDRFRSAVRDLESKFAVLDGELREGPWFAGGRFGLVDAAFGPVFRYFDVIERTVDLGVFNQKPLVQRWREALRNRSSIHEAVSRSYGELLEAFVEKQGGILARKIAERKADEMDFVSA